MKPIVLQRLGKIVIIIQLGLLSVLALVFHRDEMIWIPMKIADPMASLSFLITFCLVPIVWPITLRTVLVHRPPLWIPMILFFLFLVFVFADLIIGFSFFRRLMYPINQPSLMVIATNLYGGRCIYHSGRSGLDEANS